MTTYAVIYPVGKGYAIRFRRDLDAYGSELYGDHYVTRSQARDVIKRLGWTYVPTWKMAQLLEAAKRSA